MGKWLRISLLVVLLFGGYPTQGIAAEDTEKQEITQFVQKLFYERAKLLIHQDIELIKPMYLATGNASRYALGNERRRSQYLNVWAAARNIMFTEAESAIRIVRIVPKKDEATVTLIQSLKLTYVYPTHSYPPQSFGVGTRHSIGLKKVDNKWHVKREWYLDPLDENHNLIPLSIFPPQTIDDQNKKPAPLKSMTRRVARKPYDRERAVAYANKYAGAAAMAGNNNRYNPKYLDYTYMGGDCTNFASQVIGDPEEGGGLSMGPSWYYKYKQGGTVSWVRTDAFKNYLLHSGRGRLIARGTFDQVAKPTKRFPNSALAELQPGDLIAYEMDGDVDHFSVVTARDENGYVLVNSHTADRYHVPWDLGWDKHTRYWLIHIND